MNTFDSVAVAEGSSLLFVGHHNSGGRLLTQVTIKLHHTVTRVL